MYMDIILIVFLAIIMAATCGTAHYLSRIDYRLSSDKQISSIEADIEEIQRAVAEIHSDVSDIAHKLGCYDSVDLDSF